MTTTYRAGDSRQGPYPTLSELLTELNACRDGVALVRGKSLRQWWAGSERADHMLWLVGRMSGKPGWPKKKAVVLAACACAETALSYCSAVDRPVAQAAIETARAWARGKATLREVRTAATDATDAADAADATYAATYASAADATYAAAAAATYAATYAADATYAAANAATHAANAATYAANAATNAAANAAYAAAWQQINPPALLAKLTEKPS